MTDEIKEAIKPIRRIKAIFEGIMRIGGKRGNRILPEEWAGRSPGKITSYDRVAYYLFGTEGGQEYLESYSMPDSTCGASTYSGEILDERHARIYQDGRIVELEVRPRLTPGDDAEAFDKRYLEVCQRLKEAGFKELREYEQPITLDSKELDWGDLLKQALAKVPENVRVLRLGGGWLGIVKKVNKAIKAKQAYDIERKRLVLLVYPDGRLAYYNWADLTEQPVFWGTGKTIRMGNPKVELVVYIEGERKPPRLPHINDDFWSEATDNHSPISFLGVYFGEFTGFDHASDEEFTIELSVAKESENSWRLYLLSMRPDCMSGSLGRALDDEAERVAREGVVYSMDGLLGAIDEAGVNLEAFIERVKATPEADREGFLTALKEELGDEA